MGKVIAVINQKGGVGKTTTVINLGAALGARGFRVLLVDVDPQGNSTQGLGVDKSKVKKSTYHALIDGVRGDEIRIHTQFENLDLMPATNALLGAEIEMVDVQQREFCLRRALVPIRGEYDYILIDCPPSLGLIALNALCACDSFLVPIQCEFYALEGLSQLMNHVRLVKRSYNPKLETEGVLLTMFDSRLNLTQQVVKEVKKYFPHKVYRTVIPRNVRIAEAPSHGKPVIAYDRISRGSSAYLKLGAELVKQIEGK